MLFILWQICIRQWLMFLFRRRRLKSRLQYVREASLGQRLTQLVSLHSGLYRHLDEILQSVRAPMTVATLAVTSLFLLCCGLVLGVTVFHSLKGLLLLSVMGAAVPYLFLRMKLVGIQLRTRLEFLPAVELFYQVYVLSGQTNIRVALQKCLEENRLLYPMRPVFEQLYRNLTTDRGMDYSLRIFALALGHVWAQYFVNIIRVALTEGNPVGDNLKDLITDMRKARLADQIERNRLLEIRIANFSPIVFLFVFLMINFKLNSQSAYLYYFVDPVGRSMILDALMIIFASFLMGVYLSMKRM